MRLLNPTTIPLLTVSVHVAVCKVAPLATDTTAVSSNEIAPHTCAVMALARNMVL